jgi:hypothetical protein
MGYELIFHQKTKVDCSFYGYQRDPSYLSLRLELEACEASHLKYLLHFQWREVSINDY